MEIDMTILECRVHYITKRTDRRESGWCEVGVYVDPVLPGGSRILAAVISHPCKGAKWTLHSAGSHSRETFPSLIKAWERAWDIATLTDAGQIHYKKYFPDG
jgi:hypothetical protein